MYEYENIKRVIVDFSDAIGRAVFVPVCNKCFCFVKPNEIIEANMFEGLKKEPNAKCKRCGQTFMLFEGFF